MFRVALWMSTLIALACARIYERCELARDLQRLGVHRDQIATWVCIAYHESRFDTAAINPGSGDHGLLQISELYWCGPGKACGAPCSAFRDEDISNDVKCALKIYREHTRLQGDGFLAWVVYPHHCKQNVKKYTVDCDKNLKNIPLRLDDKARYLKSSDINDTTTNIVNNPYVNQIRPRYLAINSVLQGSDIDEFERNYYYNNKKPLNWLNFKVENIDDLQLPSGAAGHQPARYLEFSTPPTTTTTVDPDLIGIKPPSPRKIESNQFRRRKTFSEPLFLKNKSASDRKTVKLMFTPVKENPETKLSFNDLSHNIFLNLSPSVVSTSTAELSPQQNKLTDLRRYHVRTPEPEETTSKILTYEELARNPFLKSLSGFKIESTTGIPLKANKVTDLAQNVLYHVASTQNPVIYTKNGLLNYPDTYDNLQGFKKSSSQYDESATTKLLSYGDLTQNLFLTHIFKSSTVSPIQDTRFPVASENYNKELTVTTLTAPTYMDLSKHDMPLQNKLEVSTRSPYKPSVQRGNVRYFSNTNNNTEKPVTQRPTTLLSTRRYDVSRQRSSINRNGNIPSNNLTNANENNTPKVLSTAPPYSRSNESYGESHKIDATTARSSTILDNSIVENKVTVRLQTLDLPRTTSRPWATEVLGSSTRFYAAQTQNITSTTPKPSYNLKTTSKLISSSVTAIPYYSNTQKVTTKPTTVKTTQSIFDLYLRPSTRPAFTPFAFTSSFNKSPFKLSIFSGGTTKAPPSFYNSNKRTVTDEVPKKIIQKN